MRRDRPIMEQALIFAAGAARYALRLRQIEQVLSPQPMRALARAPHGIAGLVAWRGQLLPLVDLSLLYARVACRHRIGTRVIVVKAPPCADARPQEPGSGPATLNFALLAERVFDVIALSYREPAFELSGASYLGGFVDAEGQPQLVLPEAIRDLYLSTGRRSWDMAPDIAPDEAAHDPS
jgi:chemotaxis signal transduction protein